MQHPERSLHLIDVENLLGQPRPTRALAGQVQVAYRHHVVVGPDDHVVVACNHGAAIAVGDGFPGARLLVRSGPDGADLALLGVLDEEDVIARFDAVVIASGDGIFADAVAALGAADILATVVSRPEALARRLRLAAGARLVTFDPTGRPSEPASALAWREAA